MWTWTSMFITPCILVTINTLIHICPSLFFSTFDSSHDIKDPHPHTFLSHAIRTVSTADSGPRLSRWHKTRQNTIFKDVVCLLLYRLRAGLCVTCELYLLPKSDCFFCSVTAQVPSLYMAFMNSRYYFLVIARLFEMYTSCQLQIEL